MSDQKTLLQFLLDLLHDKQALADFKQDPQGALHDAGLEHVCVQDIQDLLPVVLEKEDPQKCAKYEDDCDKGQCHDDAPKHHDHHDGHRDHDTDHDDHKWQHDHDSEIDKVITHLNYVTNNYSFDSHDTIYNTDNITKIWADHGAKVDVTNDTHNVGAGGVDVEGNNSGPITTGNHDVIGHDNQISGDGSTTSFGNGSALSHVGTGEGGAINTGTGTATGESEHNTSQAFGAGSTVTSATHGAATTTNTDTNNHTTTTTDTNSHNDNSQHDVGNTTQHDVGNTDTDTSTHNDHSFDTSTDSHDNNSTNIDHNSLDLHVHH